MFSHPQEEPLPRPAYACAAAIMEMVDEHFVLSGLHCDATFRVY